MKNFNFILVITSLIYLLNSNLGLATDSNNHQALDSLNEIIKLQETKISFSSSHSKIILVKDSDRGCCAWKTEKTKCAYTNESYCRVRANEADIKFEFYKNKSCRELQVCK